MIVNRSSISAANLVLIFPFLAGTLLSWQELSEYLLSLNTVGSTITPSISAPGFVTREVVMRRLNTLKETKGFE
jgi:hypothetical protein